MVLPWLALPLLVLLALYPPTAPWSERFLTPLVAAGSGLYLLRRRENLPWGLGLLLWGVGDLVGALEDLAASPRSLLWESPYLAGYLALTYALWRLPPRPPRLTLGLLPLGLLALLHPELGMDRLYVAWDALLLLLLLPRLEGLFQERFQPGLALLGVGVLLVLVADLAYGYLEAMGGYPTGHPLHLLYTLGYLLLALGVEGRNVPTFPALALALGGLFLLPAVMAKDPVPFALRLLALYGGLAGALGLLYALHLEWRRTEERGRRWTRFLEALARLSPRVTQTLSPEGVLLGVLEAAQELLPQAVGLELRARGSLVGERAPHLLPVPLNGDAAYLHPRTPPEEPVPPGLFHRRGLEVELPKLLALSRRYRAPVSVVMLDIDRFKAVNDTYGHPVGDEVLRRLGRILKQSVRKEDLAVRYGGEEFLLVLFGAEREAAKEVVERIRERFRSERVAPIPYPLTLSAGIAGGEVPEGRETLEEWILKADYALLRAKETGRDRVTLA